MTNKNNLAKREKQDIAEVEQPDRFYMPAVDICENADTIRLLADMPGTDLHSIDVSVENGVLTIEGNGRVDTPEGYELAGLEYAVGRFRRDFTLSEQVNVEGIKAKVNNGTLELTIPKRDEVKTKKIQITE